jgi:hypothetical protein
VAEPISLGRMASTLSLVPVAIRRWRVTPAELLVGPGHYARRAGAGFMPENYLVGGTVSERFVVCWVRVGHSEAACSRVRQRAWRILSSVILP